MTRRTRVITRRTRRIGASVGIAIVALSAATLAHNTLTADAFRYPDEAEALLVLDGTQLPPNDGFHMRVDTNGFSNDGGSVIDTHMFCVQFSVTYRCHIGNDLLRVQREPGVLAMSPTDSNRVAWILTNRAGYDDEEVQYAVWCITDPGAATPVRGSAQLCADATTHAVPAAAQLTLEVLGNAAVIEGQSVHFALTADAPIVHLAVDDGGSGPQLCGSAAGNAHASISGDTLMQELPAATRTFELCLNRPSVDHGSIAATLSASLDASGPNLQVWAHPTNPTQCQGLVDVNVSSSVIHASASGTWLDSLGSLTITKSVLGNVADGASFTVEIEGPAGTFTHDFPDDDATPWAHTFGDLTPGVYAVTESATGGATHVVVSDSPVAVLPGTDTPVSITNQFVGQLRITKHADVARDGTYPFRISCTFDDAPVGTFPDPIELAIDESYTTPELPAGTTCTVDELDTGGAHSTVIDFGAGAGAQSTGTQAEGVVIVAGTTIDVAFTNVFATGSTVTTIGSTTTDGPANPQGNPTPPTVDESLTPTTQTALASSGIWAEEWAFAAFASVIAGLALILGLRRRRILSRP